MSPFGFVIIILTTLRIEVVEIICIHATIEFNCFLFFFFSLFFSLVVSLFFTLLEKDPFLTVGFFFSWRFLIKPSRKEWFNRKTVKNFDEKAEGRQFSEFLTVLNRQAIWTFFLTVINCQGLSSKFLTFLKRQDLL